MSRFYVSSEGVDETKLSFLGYTLIRQDDEFWLYQDYAGDEYIVRKSDPYMYVDDVNDALYINATRLMNVPEV